MRRKFVSDMIDNKDLATWNDGDRIFIEAGTGQGKSHWVKNVLYELAKGMDDKILFFVHRARTKDQFIQELQGKSDIIDVRTYQALENHLSPNSNVKDENRINLSDYKYIICDECQYFIDDGNFNNFTDISLDTILDTNSIVIFMTATSEDIKWYLENVKHIELIEYGQMINYNFINKNLLQYTKDTELFDFIDNILENTDDKILVFCERAKDCCNYYKRYKEYSLFLCGKSSLAKYGKYIEEDKINNMLENEKFKERILFTTTCLDAGANLKDEKIKHIVIDRVVNINTIKQCLGRRRFLENEVDGRGYKTKINLIFRGKTKFELNNDLKNTRSILNLVDLFNEDREEFNKIQFRKNRDSIFYENTEGETVYNKLVYYSKYCRELKLNEILKVGHVNYIQQQLRIKCIRNLSEIYHKGVNKMKHKDNDLIQVFIDKYKTEKLYKDDRDELIRLCGITDSRGRKQKSVSSISGYLQANYGVKVESTKVKENGKLITVWIIV